MSDTKELQDALAAEKRAAKTLELGGATIPLGVAVLLYVVSLLFGNTNGFSGAETLLGLGDVSIMEQVFALASAIGMILTLITLVARRTMLAQIAWMLVGLGLFVALWAFWAANSTGPGFYLLLLGDIIAVVAFARIIMHKSPEQRAAEERVRELAARPNAVVAVQTHTPKDAADDNPVLIDDRRAQAAERHRRQREN